MRRPTGTTPAKQAGHHVSTIAHHAPTRLLLAAAQSSDDYFTTAVLALCPRDELVMYSARVDSTPLAQRREEKTPVP